MLLTAAGCIGRAVPALAGSLLLLAAAFLAYPLIAFADPATQKDGLTVASAEHR